ncbi:MAG: MFS transporter [Acidimicrobiales bacterium]
MTEPQARPPIPLPLRVLLGAYFLNAFATVGTVTIVGKQVFDMTGRELDLGLIGLAEFLPMALLAPITGSLADRFDRRLMFGIGLTGDVVVSIAMFSYVNTDPTAVGPIFGLMVLFALTRSVGTPAARAITIDMAPPDVLERVIPLRSVAFQAGIISGPLVLAWVFVLDIAAPYLVAAAAYGLAVVIVASMPKLPTRKLSTRGGMQAIRDAREGLRFIRRQPVVFGAISLDLFAVLFGGIIALLPAIAEKRLGVGAVGLGGLRAAVGAGSAVVALGLAVRPLRRHVGKVLLGVIAVFGVMHVAVALTTNYIVAVVALVIAAGSDQISVYIRSTLVPLATPEEMRGRVLAVENVFIGASNELGAVESGLTAAAFGLVGAMLFGSVGTLVVVALWWRYFPALRNVDRFSDVRAP